MNEMIPYQRNLTRRLRQLSVLLIILLMPIGAWAQDDYSEDYSKIITVDSKDESVWIVDTNADNILGDGTISYNATNNVLTLNNINLACTKTDATFISCVDYSQALNTLTVHLVGSNTITLGNNAGFFYGSALTFTTDDNYPGSLTITKEDGWSGKLFENSANGDPTITPTFNNHLYLDHDGESECLIQWLTPPGLFSYNNGNNIVFRFGYETGNDDEVIHYSIDYVDESLQDVTDTVYDVNGDDQPLLGPCTMTYYITAGGGRSETKTAKLFGIATNSVTTTIGTPVAPPTIVPTFDHSEDLIITETQTPATGVAPDYDGTTGLISTSAVGETTCSVKLSYYSASWYDYLVLNEMDDNQKYQFGSFTLTVNEAVSYNLRIGDTQVTSANASDIFGNSPQGEVNGEGLARFAITTDPTTNEEVYTLTLENATISDYQEWSVFFAYPKLTVHLIGENHIVNGFCYYGQTPATGTIEFTSDGGEGNCLIFDSAESVDDLSNPDYYVGFSHCTYNEISDETGWTFGMYEDPEYHQQHLKLYKQDLSGSGEEKYDLWIGDIQVTERNCTDILGDGDANKKVAGSFQYVPDLNKLFITNSIRNQRIETKNDEGLTVYLAPNSSNAVGSIVYTGNGNAPLTITTDGNYPGTISLSANSNVISGFSSLTLEQNLVIMEPEDITYDGNNKRLGTTSATIGVPLSPITDDEPILPDGNELKPEGGSNDVNKVVDDILYTLGNANNNEGDGYDDEGCIVINTVTSDQQAAQVTQNCIPGTDEYLEGFKGLTFMVPAGNGTIKFDVQTFEGYVMKVMVGDAAPVTVEKTDKGVFEVPYNVAEPTYVYAYNGGKTGDGDNARSIHKGKKTTVHIKIYSISISSKKVKSANPASEASGGSYKGDTSELEGQVVLSGEEIEAGKGDVNGDTVVNAADVVEMVNAITGKKSTTFDKTAADLNGDGVVNIADIMKIVKKVLTQ